VYLVPYFAMFLVAVALAVTSFAQSVTETSGRPLPAEQGAYDVLHYDLTLRVDPTDRTIAGVLVMRAKLLEATPAILLDLDQRLTVTGVHAGEDLLDFTHEEGEIVIRSEELFTPVDSIFEVAVSYQGRPRSAPNPPWRGGFVWARTESGEAWIATACQSEGADLWWPCKDQPDDEPDSMDLHFTVPESLTVASNGSLVAIDRAGEGWRTWHWHVSTPINNYGVAFNAAPYETIRRDFESVAGERFPVIYWVLPENLEKGKVLFEDILAQMVFFEEIFGPYPFRADKYGVVETPHLGMEHQTIVAYGNRYRGNPWGPDAGFDFLHHHEFAHEWWGNLVTARSWADFWIHEGFATYAQALYVERLRGAEAYRAEMRSKRRLIRGRSALVPREPCSTREINSPQGVGTDAYYRGSWTLHTLRWVIGDEAFFRALRRMAYPTPERERAIDGSQCRFVTSADLEAIIEEEAGGELDWFFAVYLHQADLPRLRHEERRGELHLRWEVPGDLPFPMPVPVRIGGEIRRVEMPGGRAVVTPGGEGAEGIDPYDRILRDR
jgi:aminopeptidase N